MFWYGQRTLVKLSFTVVTVFFSFASLRHSFFNFCSSAKCQRDHWPKHRHHCLLLKSSKLAKENGVLMYYDSTGRLVAEAAPVNLNDADFTVNIKYSGEKKALRICRQWDGDLIFKLISQNTRIPVTDMKVIIKGRVVTPEDITDCISQKTLIMVLGVKAESSEGLNEKDIDCLMAQMNVDRNMAIKSLKKSGSLLDAMLTLGE